MPDLSVKNIKNMYTLGTLTLSLLGCIRETTRLAIVIYFSGGLNNLFISSNAPYFPYCTNQQTERIDTCSDVLFAVRCATDLPTK